MIIIGSWITHPLVLIITVILSLFAGRIDLAFWNFFGWLFLNLIFGKSSYLYGLLERKRNKPASIDELAKGENLASIRKFLERESPVYIYELLKRKKPEYARESLEGEKPASIDELLKRKKPEYVHESLEPVSIFESLRRETLIDTYELLERKKPEFIRELLKGESPASIRKFWEREKE